MSDSASPEVGGVGWMDLTVPEAEDVRDFYCKVVGWTADPVEMNGYADFNMKTPDRGRVIAGICHARGSNAGLPAQWLLYITVSDLDRSMTACADLGGEILVPPGLPAGTDRFCVIRDPAGAVAALYEPARRAGSSG